jgi:glutamate-5-semialdehyde dehydrogenase
MNRRLPTAEQSRSRPQAGTSQGKKIMTTEAATQDAAPANGAQAPAGAQGPAGEDQAAVIAEDHDAVAQFFNSYTGTAAFHNATPRLLDGFTLFSIPETGINIDRVPGPRGPVTFRDLHLRQLVIRPAMAP